MDISNHDQKEKESQDNSIKKKLTPSEFGQSLKLSFSVSLDIGVLSVIAVGVLDAVHVRVLEDLVANIVNLRLFPDATGSSRISDIDFRDRCFFLKSREIIEEGIVELKR